jgi:hypothetical protein
VVSIKPFRESKEQKNDTCDHWPGKDEAREKAFIALGGEFETQLPYQDARHRSLVQSSGSRQP